MIYDRYNIFDFIQYEIWTSLYRLYVFKIFESLFTYDYYLILHWESFSSKLNQFDVMFSHSSIFVLNLNNKSNKNFDYA